ncbi:MAG: hypothetical protein RR073_03020 [Clostridia bacterium]
MESGKTIKQVADELGVSKTAINKEITNLGLRSKLNKIGNQFTIGNQEVELIADAFKKRAENQAIKQNEIKNEQSQTEEKTKVDETQELSNEEVTNDNQQSKTKEETKAENQSETKIETTTDNQTQTESQTTMKLISMLQNELEIKNKQIDDLNSRLAEANRMAENAQGLHAGTIKQQLITDGTKKSGIVHKLKCFFKGE